MSADPTGFKLYAVVNFQTCGWCKKFRPVWEQNTRAMNPRSQSRVELVQLDTPAGKAKASELGFSGGIPTLLATKDGNEVYRKPGYQDGKTFANTLFTLFSTYA